MQGRILIVDAIATNRIVLKVKLTTAFYDVIQSSSVEEAIAAARADLPDLVIVALALPDGDAATLCTALRESPLTAHIPTIAIGCQPPEALRMRTLAAGAHDVLTHPIDETLLLGRVRSLIRAHNAAAEWHMREDTCRALGLAEPVTGFEDQGSCLLIGRDLPVLQGHAAKLRGLLRLKIGLGSNNQMMQRLAGTDVPDVIVLALPPGSAEAQEDLRLISALRAAAGARHAGMIVLQSRRDPALGAQALDLGADDLMTDGFNAAELALRIKAVMRRKRMAEQLRASVRTGLQAAVFDPLTGLYNRRYAMPHLGRVAAHAMSTGRSFAVMAADLDLFKRINDHYGHASGDAVLIEVANRLRGSLRHTDMIARIGGEEFLIILPGTTAEEAHRLGQRVCADIGQTPFIVPGSAAPISVTISVGMAVGYATDPVESDPDRAGRRVLEEADRRLYAAKEHGRNQVNRGRPAA